MILQTLLQLAIFFFISEEKLKRQEGNLLVAYDNGS